MSSDHAQDSVLALVHRGWNHLHLQRPLAAWASWQHALRLDPDSRAAEQALATWESAVELPAAARTVYRFQSPRDEARRVRWDDHLKRHDLQDLDTAAGAFAALADADPTDAPARYNQALCLAWLGRNAAALAALNRAGTLWAADDFERAVDLYTLAEVLRQGAGAEPKADDLRFTWIVEWDARDTDRLVEDIPGLRPLPSPPDPVTGTPLVREARVFEWLDRPMPDPATEAISPARLPRVLATVVVTPRTLRLSSPIFETLAPASEILLNAVGDPARPVDREATPLPFPLLDAAVWTVRLPVGLDDADRRALTRGAVEDYYENRWIHVPRHGLGGKTPLGASHAARAGNLALRARLAAIVRVREQLGARPSALDFYQGYPFDRLRRRLGLEPDDAATVDPADPSCMSPDDLDHLDPGALDAHRLAEAYSSALPLGDEARAGRFAAELSRRDALKD